MTRSPSHILAALSSMLFLTSVSGCHKPTEPPTAGSSPTTRAAAPPREPDDSDVQQMLLVLRTEGVGRLQEMLGERRAFREPLATSLKPELYRADLPYPRYTQHVIAALDLTESKTFVPTMREFIASHPLADDATPITAATVRAAEGGDPASIGRITLSFARYCVVQQAHPDLAKSIGGGFELRGDGALEAELYTDADRVFREAEGAKRE